LLIIALWAVAIYAFVVVAFTWYVMARYGATIIQVFKRKPLLVADDHPPAATAQPVSFMSSGGRMLRGSYLCHLAPRRIGVILFCHEFTGDRWLWEPYLSPLLAEGFDVLAFDFCNHGASDAVAGYEPLQWVTEHEVADVRAALDYLKNRPDADPWGVGGFGVSKGGGALIAAAAREPYLRALVADGAYPNHGTVVEYMTKWVGIFAPGKFVYDRLPRWFYGALCELTLLRLQRMWKVRYARLERSLKEYGARPLLAIHGERDNYITVSIAERFFGRNRGAENELWIVPGAKHNQCASRGGDEYRDKLRHFYMKHLGGDRPRVPAPPGEPLVAGAGSDDAGGSGARRRVDAGSPIGAS
jgi:pimeloyl-ACP methyl ester carboxylesterase